MSSPTFERLTLPTREVAEAFSRWESDPALIPLMRPNRCEADLTQRSVVTLEELSARMRDHAMFLIFLEGRLVGEMNYMVDPDHLFHAEPGTAWVGITVGEALARGRGLGTQAMRYLEDQIWAAGLTRIELGVFSFNAPAIHTYRKLGYTEIGRIPDFTYWQGRMWEDIRMEKRFTGSAKPLP